MDKRTVRLKSLRSVRSFSRSRLACSIPVVVSMFFAATVIFVDLNQFVVGSLNCNLNIIHLRFHNGARSNPSAQIVSASLLESSIPRFLSTSHRFNQTNRVKNAEIGKPELELAAGIASDLQSTVTEHSRRQQLTRSNEGDDENGESDNEVLMKRSLDELNAVGLAHLNVANDFERNSIGANRDGPVDKKSSLWDQQLSAQTGTQLLSEGVGDWVQEAGADDSPPSLDSADGKEARRSAVGDSELTKADSHIYLSPPADCNIFHGHWVYDETYPLYAPSSCPFVDEGFDCLNNGRPDTDYLKWRWQPYDCDMPRFNGTDLLERLRGKRLTYVGDSLGRNQWESMLCLLYTALPNKTRVYEVNGAQISKVQTYLGFLYEDFNATVEFYRAPFLVHNGKRSNDAPPEVKSTLELDFWDSSYKKWPLSQMLVFNTGHWWTEAKTLRSNCYFSKGGKLLNISVLEAFKMGIETWASFIDQFVDPVATRVFFRSFSPSHFRGGQWNTGGQCNVETTPYLNRTRTDIYTPPTEKVGIIEKIITRMKFPVILLNATELTDYRRDGHPSKWTLRAGTYGTGVNGSRYQDCSHWCLPGVPDSWNELLYASLVMNPDAHSPDRTKLWNEASVQHERSTYETKAES